MKKGEGISILFAENDPDQIKAIRRAFKTSPMNVVVRESGTLREYRKLAAAHPPDIAILDLSLPDGGAIEALTSPPEAGPFPIIVMASQGDEQAAVEAMKAGALDYIIKSPEALAGLPFVVERFLHQWGSLQRLKRREEALRKSEEKYRAIIETNQEWIWQMNKEGIHTYSNPAIERILGFSIEEIVGTDATIHMHPEDRRKIEEMLPQWIEHKKGWNNLDVRWLHKDGSIRWLESNAVPMLDVNSELIGFQGSDRDTTERKLAEERLRREQDLYRDLVDALPVGAYRLRVRPAAAWNEENWNSQVESHYSVDFVSDRYCEILGISRQEFERNPGIVPDRVHPEDKPGFIKKNTEAILSLSLFSWEGRMIVPAKGTIWVHFESIPRLLENGDVVWTGIVNNITEGKRAEEALRESEQKYRTLFDNAGEAIFVVQDGKLVFCNPMTARLLGYPSEEIKIKPFTEFIHSEDRNMVVERHLKRLRGEELPGVYSFRFVDSEGRTRWADLSAVLINWEGRAATLNFVSDVTERKRAEEAIQAALREKDVLLREIHHRVKNNMQVISSLFNLQAGYIKDEKAIGILREGQTRIRTMALVHEKLYQSGNMSQIDLAGYIQSLSAHLFHVYLVDSNQVRLETEFEDIPLDINSAVPCGLIFNELISNALKHGFPMGRKGVLTIRLRRQKDGGVEFRVSDDGVGFPKGLDFRNTETLGLQIVNLLVGQLEGTIELDRKNGTAFTVAFREMKQGLRT